MEYVIVGLGNPGEEYKQTRHNVGRMIVETLAERWGTSDWRQDTKLRAALSKGALPDSHSVTLVLPEAYMNRSGASVAPLVKNTKQAERLIIIHDDIDLGLGSIRIVFNRGAGGHRGVESIERALKTRAYVRVRVGVVPTTPKGTLKKPKGEEHVHDFILKTLSKKDTECLNAIVSHTCDAVEVLVREGRSFAMQKYNGTPVTISR